MFCPNCGTEMPDHAAQCSKCGAALPNGTVQTAKKGGTLKKIGKVLVAVLVLLFVLAMCAPDSENPPAEAGGETGQTTAEPSGTEPETTDAAGTADDTEDEAQAAVGALEMYQWVAENVSSPFVISEQAAAFITEHTDFFPGNASIQGAMSDFVNYELTYPMLAKNAKKYGDALYSLWGTVIDIDEAEDGSITQLQVADYEGKQYMLYYLGALDEVFEEDEVSCLALPFDVITFENMGGSYTEAIAMGACYVEKSEY